MMFSKACEDGIRAVIYIAEQSLNGRKASVEDIALGIDSPVEFTAKVLDQLARSNIVHSQTGQTGGFTINDYHMRTTKLVQIVRAFDGDVLLAGCGLGLKDCDELHPCPIHNQFKFIRHELRQMLEKSSVYDMATAVDSGKTFLKR